MAGRVATAVIVGALALASCADSEAPKRGSPPKTVTTACDRYAAPTGHARAPGTRDRPFSSVQRLADALAGGGTGCLLPGVYREYVRVEDGGRARRPLVLRGDHATLAGVLWIDRADHVQVTGLVVDGSRAREIPLQIMGDDVVFRDNEVTTSGLRRSCMILGSNGGYGRASRVAVRGNRFERCGSLKHGNKDHSIYVENADDGDIVGNSFTATAAYAVHLYPNAQRMRVANNLMQGNGGGVMIAGDERYASSGNVIERNVITGSTRFHDVESSWGGAVGKENLVRSNCLWGGVGGPLGDTDGFEVRDNAVAPPGPRCQRLVRGAAVAGAHRAARSSSAP
jgi:hypothetical protein